VPDFDSSLSPSRSPSPVVDRKPTLRLPTPLSPPLRPPASAEICFDDEDLYFAKLALLDHDSSPGIEGAVPESLPDPPLLRKHVSGSARTEGFYKISHAEKLEYVTQYQTRSANSAGKDADSNHQQQHVTSSRSNRANARRRAQGLEEMNQVQRAVALSKGENANELSFKFNQLQTRKKHLRFARSPIHDWGLYAMERISRGEMVIEYVGEVIRAQVADKREKTYERQGIGSSYLFRIDEDLVVDATKKGNLG
jgi:[histone H3]-lysine4 N-trimethyltransferase SETD1